jgi:hypothetical protein
MPLLRVKKSHTLSWNRWCAIFLCLLVSVPLHAPAQQTLSREFQIKAVFLFNFTQFVQWPADAFSDRTSPFVIGVLGEDPFGAYLDETIMNEAVGNHKLVVERYATVEDIKNCHILFVSLANKLDVRRALDVVKGKPVLTVSDREGFARAGGGMVRLYNEAGHIRLRINVQPVTEAKLVMSSKLLSLADIVQGKNN